MQIRDAGDHMAHDLPVADTTRLSRSPLELVVCQIRFEETLAVSDSRLIFAFHKALGGSRGHYPKIESVKGNRVEIAMGLGRVAGPVSEVAFSGWRMQSTDGWVVTVMPDNVALESARYTTWSADFLPRLEALIDATTRHIKPATEQRVGLRYVDRVSEPAVARPEAWRGLISDDLLGAILHPVLGPLVVGAQQHVVLDLEDGVRAIVRAGMLGERTAPESLAFVLDFDVFREGVREFDAASIKEAVSHFHDLNLRLFQQVATKELRDRLTPPRRGSHGR